MLKMYYKKSRMKETFSFIKGASVTPLRKANIVSNYLMNKILR